MIRISILALFLVAELSVAGQPFVDPLQVRYTHGFTAAHANRATPFDHVWAGSDIPVKLKEKTYLLVSPYYERWQFDSVPVQDHIADLQGIVLPVGLLAPLGDPKWSLSVTALLRSNGQEVFGVNTFQAGGAGFFSYEISPGKKIRFGVYVNKEFFGWFVMPLAGADWKAGERDYFFGLLPGRFTWEHRLNKNLFTGLSFRAITNSFRMKGGSYARVDDNQLSAYLDLYPAKKICLGLEGGYGLYRKLRTGSGTRNYFGSREWGDGWFIRLSASWRIRFAAQKG